VSRSESVKSKPVNDAVITCTKADDAHFGQLAAQAIVWGRGNDAIGSTFMNFVRCANPARLLQTPCGSESAPSAAAIPFSAVWPQQRRSQQACLRRPRLMIRR